MKLTQAAFAASEGVSRKSVTVWKREGRIAMDGNLVDVEKSRELLARTRRQAPRRRRAAVTPQMVTADAAEGNSAHPQVTGRAVYASGANYDNPANLPDEPVNSATQIDDGAVGMARLIADHLPIATVRLIVDTWVRIQRAGWVGGPGLPDSIADDDEWPEPPIGFGRWSDHPLFTGPAVSDMEWAEIEAKARAPR